MFKPVQVANKSWWVPANNGLMLAVKLDNPDNYHQAIQWKMERLIKAEGLESAALIANRILRQEGALALDRSYNPEHLAKQVLENSLRISATIRDGAPEMAQPEEQSEAISLVESQQDLDWEGFLT